MLWAGRRHGMELPGHVKDSLFWTAQDLALSGDEAGGSPDWASGLPAGMKHRSSTRFHGEKLKSASPLSLNGEKPSGEARVLSVWAANTELPQRRLGLRGVRQTATGNGVKPDNQTVGELCSSLLQSLDSEVRTDFRENKPGAENKVALGTLRRLERITDADVLCTARGPFELTPLMKLRKIRSAVASDDFKLRAKISEITASWETLRAEDVKLKRHRVVKH